MAGRGRRTIDNGAIEEMAGVLIVQPIGALIAGVLILIFPRLLNYVVALYLILIGVVGLAPHFVGQVPI